MRIGKQWVQFNRFMEEFGPQIEVGIVASRYIPESSLVCLPRIQICRRFLYGSLSFGMGDRRQYRICHRLRDLILDSEHISQITIVALCPDVIARLRVNKLRRDPNPVATAAHAAFNHVAHA